MVRVFVTDEARLLQYFADVNTHLYTDCSTYDTSSWWH